MKSMLSLLTLCCAAFVAHAEDYDWGKVSLDFQKVTVGALVQKFAVQNPELLVVYEDEAYTKSSIWLRAKDTPWKDILTLACCMNTLHWERVGDTIIIQRGDMKFLKGSLIVDERHKPLSDEKVTVDFPDEEIVQIIGNLATIYDLNVAISDHGVAGRTSIKLQDVDYLQIFEVVLEPIQAHAIFKDGIYVIDNAAYLCCPPCFSSYKASTVTNSGPQ